MMHIYKVPLVLTRQPEGGYTVTSPMLPELVTEGDTIDEALLHVQDAVQAVVELYEGLGKPLPVSLCPSSEADVIQFEFVWDVPCSPVRSPGNCGVWAAKNSHAEVEGRTGSGIPRQCGRVQPCQTGDRRIARLIKCVRM